MRDEIRMAMIGRGDRVDYRMVAAAVVFMPVRSGVAAGGRQTDNLKQIRYSITMYEQGTDAFRRAGRGCNPMLTAMRRGAEFFYREYTDDVRIFRVHPKPVVTGNDERNHAGTATGYRRRARFQESSATATSAGIRPPQFINSRVVIAADRGARVFWGIRTTWRGAGQIR
jgi:hypothetical protein